MPSNIETARLKLRAYREDDLDAFASLNANDEVRCHVGGSLTRAETVIRFRSFFDGGPDEAWAITLPDTGAYIGHCWLLMCEHGSFSCPASGVGATAQR
ncbi:MAG: hypothetical protein JWM16_5580 [Verrucomicrobiales bacterium]|nr:hypothetical protein [Verrucomicrobiales bacterium]